MGAPDPAATGNRIVVVGAGFGGLWAAKRLLRHRLQVTVLDRNNYHTFFPLLYQIAAAELAPDNIVRPIRSILRKFRNVSFCLGEVTGIEFDSKTVLADGQVVLYDYLILATGSVTNYLGVPGAAEHAFPLRTLEQAVSLRNHILTQIERAALETDAEIRLAVLDVLGREVALVAEGTYAAGRHEAVFDAEHLPSGLYLVRLESEGRMDSQRITLLK
ncbi:MAG: FAD-dependent oxidoreductase [Gemmatimonadetes bacterium]|nr:FAD-dependent oxidoreductase [Gemmatimonadota bacterium]